MSSYVNLTNFHPRGFSSQLAKLAGNRVVATCGGQEKAEFLKNLGVDRVIDYKKENIESVNGLSNLT